MNVAPSLDLDRAELVESSPSEPTYLAVIDHIDFDTLVSAWTLRELVAQGNCTLKVVDSKNKLPEEETAGFDVVEYLDCGEGDLDHHGKNLERTSSLELLCKKYGLLEDPGMSVLLEVSKKVDNAEEIPWDSIAWSVNGLEFNRDFKDPETGEVDNQRIFEFASVIFDQNYRQTKNRFDAKREYEYLLEKKLIDVRTLSNGRTVVFLDGKPRLRNEAFARGADVVMFTEYVNRRSTQDGFHAQIAVNRNVAIDLAPLVASIRKEELVRRYKTGHLIDLAQPDRSGMHPLVPGWFMLDPQRGFHKLIVCGTRKHPLKDPKERTRHSKGSLLNLVHEFAAALPEKIQD